MRATLGVLAIAVLLGASPIPAYAAETLQPTRLVIEVAEPAQQGEPHQTTLQLTDTRGAPLGGQPIVVWEQIRLFDYADTVPVGEVRTDYRGVATLTHTPTVPGSGRLTAEFAGDDTYAVAMATAPVHVEKGVGLPTRVFHVPPDPLLPRGVTAAWFVPLLVGVWLAIAAAIYHLVRIPGERRERRDA